MRLSLLEGLTVEQEPYSDALYPMLPATQILMLQIQAGILGLRSMGSDHDIGDGSLQLHGEKPFPAKMEVVNLEEKLQVKFLVRGNHCGPWDCSFTWLPVPASGLNKSLVMQRVVSFSYRKP